MEMTPGVSDSSQEASGVSEIETKQQYEKDKHDGIAYDSYQKAVSQKKAAQQRIAELEAKLTTVEQGKMQAEGKKDELIAALRKQTQELESKYKQSQSSYTWNVVGAQIKAELAARGVSNPDKALTYAKAVHKDDLGAIEVDSDFSVNKADMQRFVDKFLNENQDMGFVSKVKVKDLSPGKVEMKKDSNKPLDKLSKEELMKVWQAQQQR